MDDGRDDFNIPENADQMLFVDDLIGYMELQYTSDYVSEWDPVPFRQYIHNAFNRTIQNAIYFFENTLEMDHEDIFIQIQNENFVHSDIFERFAENLAICYFSEGFDAKFFLIYCVHLCRISSYFYMNGILDATVLARKHILKFLQNFNMLDGGWDTVHRTAEMYEKMLIDSENIPTPQSPDSDESECQDRPQNEEIGDESNICLSEEQNVSPDNESNLKEQEEGACSIKEPFLEESAQCSSEISAINPLPVNPLEEFKSSPGDSSLKISLKGNNRINISESIDKLRAFTSKGGKESLILIKSDCRRRMNLAWNDAMSGNSQACIEGNKLIDVAAPDDRFCPGPSNANKESSFLDKSNCKGKLDRSLNAKDNEQSKTSNFEEQLIGNTLLDGELRTEIPNTAQKSPNEASCKRKHNLSPDDENGANSQAMSSGGNNFDNKIEPNKKLVPEAPNVDKISALSNIIGFSSSKEGNTDIENIPLTDEEASPKFERHLKLEGLSSASSDEERSPSGDGNS